MSGRPEEDEKSPVPGYTTGSENNGTGISPTPTLQHHLTHTTSHAAPTSESASTEVGDALNEKREYMDEQGFSYKGKGRIYKDARFEDRGIHEVDDEGNKKKKVRVVMEQKTGKELIAEVEDGGKYTTPRWRHSLPFLKPKYPPPPAPLSLDDPEVTPEATASLFSIMFFNWISPMMALGSARPLQPTDLWKMDDARSSAILSEKLVSHLVARQERAAEFNRLLEDPSTPLPLWPRLTFPLMPNREAREKEYRTKSGKRSASLGWALSDTFGAYFWMGGTFKIVGDLAQSTTPLTLRALISWSGKYNAQKNNPGVPGPGIGPGIGMSFGILGQLLLASFCIHHFFVRGMSTGVQLRSAIIASVYRRSLRLTQKSRGEIPNGKIINHISTDTSRIDFAAGFFHMAWTSPIQFVVIAIILLAEIGYSALPGIGFLLLGLPIQTWVMKSFFRLRKRSMLWTDKRAKLLQEILGGMRIVKFMAWENPFLERLGGIRGMELRYVRRLLRFRSGLMAFAMSLPVIAAILSFITYSVTQHSLEPAKIFSVITLFQLMRMPLMIWPMSLSACADALNALRRLEVVFEAELLTEERIINPRQADAVVINHASFIWDAAPVVDDGLLQKMEAKAAAKNGTGPKVSSTPSKKSNKKKFRFNKKTKKVTLADETHAEISGQPSKLAEAGTGGGPPPSAPGVEEDTTSPSSSGAETIFQVKDVDLSIPRGSLTAVVGPIGSGKSSLLQGLMGEMRRTEGKVSFSGSTALCAQTPWIQNATVRENILFGQPWDEERYWAAVRDSCLEPDLELLEDGDGTEIGEKGINLSGGQKQRVNIARAVYFNADIIALDDPLSALDAGVGKALFFNAIVGALSGKTRILVTHALHFLPYVDNIIVMNDGRVSEQGTYNELKAAGGAFSRLIRDFGADDEHEAREEAEEEAISKSLPAIKHDRAKMVAQGTVKSLMQDEERNSGALKAGTYRDYFKAGKGHFMIPLLLLAVCIYQGAFVITSFWLVWWQEGRWGRSNAFFMGMYAMLGVSSAIAMFFQGFTNATLNYFASVTLHRDAIKRVMFAPQSFFDTTPLGRIMNRFSKDIDTIDNTLADAMRMTVGTLGSIIGATILVAILEPYFLLAVAFVLALYAHNAQFYRRSAREFKRIDSILRSSLYSHFSESLSGIATIRSYGESERFCDDNIKRMDIENRAYYLTIINQRWLGIRLDMLGSLLTFTVAIIVCTANLSPANGGLGLSTMITVQQSFSWLVRQIAEVENDMVGAERIMHYANTLEQEAPHRITGTQPPATWPAEGAIKFDNVRMRYREELPDVLKGLSIDVKANEKVGVVGRTGAGKSSIMVSLFRMCELSGGSITIDGVDISKIGLNELRSGMSIIPQDPLLFSGTLRSNIDPFNTKSDVELYDALRRAHLVHSDHPRPSLAIETLPSGAQTPLASGAQTPGQRRFTLDMAIEEEGGNLSVGERSLVSLARALVRGTKVLVLDEATASVDVETDAKIQSTIREQFRDRTLLCIAHRLRTILSYDRILVMSDGAVEEFDTPLNLFLNDGAFREMCNKSAITLEDIKAAVALRF